MANVISIGRNAILLFYTAVHAKKKELIYNGRGINYKNQPAASCGEWMAHFSISHMKGKSHSLIAWNRIITKLYARNWLNTKY